MLRMRTLVLAIAAASAFSGAAHALGLGELTLKSAQNQPLEAEIELLDAQGLSAAEVVPSLAPQDEFAKAGVGFSSTLQDLRFTPVINPNGRSVLRVTSSQPLPEPVLRFLVQVMWPQGRLLRDYSVALDRTQAGEAAPARAAASPAVSTASRTTKARDTLWQIAAQHRQGGSVQQAMLAIQALNPDAFIGNNINQLKTGQVLRLPDAQQVQSIPQGEAERDVAEQYAAWREGRRLGPRARQLDATRQVTAGAAPARIAQDDNLRLVSPNDKANADKVQALSDQLAVAEESLDTSRRENDELKSRMGDLQSQLDKLQRLIALKNDQLARLQAQAGAAPPDAGAAATATNPDGAAAPAATAAGTEAGAAPATPGTPTGDGIVLPGEQVPGQTATPVQGVTPETAIIAAPAAGETPPPAPMPEQAATAPTPGVLDKLWGNPLLLGLIAASALLVLLLLILLLARRQKALQEEQKHLRMARALAEENERDADLELPADSFDDLDVAAPSVTLSPAVVAASVAGATAAPRPSDMFEPKPADPHAVLLADAQRSLDEGRLNHAASLLEPAVAEQPARQDLRLKLMEVYARQGDQYGFAEQARHVPVAPEDQAQVEALRERFPAMLGVAATAGVGAAALAAEDNRQHVETLLQPPPAPAAAAPAAADDTFDSDFDLSLDGGEQDMAGQPPALDVTDLTPPDAVTDADADDDFEALLAQAQAQAASDDLSAFDLAETDAANTGVPATGSPAAGSLSTESPGDLDALSDLDMADDFDLSLSLDDTSPEAQRFDSEMNDVNAELDGLDDVTDAAPRYTAEDASRDAEISDDLDFDFFSGSDEVATKLDLARAYIDMGDHQGARDILDEVVKDGDGGQRRQAEDLLSRLV